MGTNTLTTISGNIESGKTIEAAHVTDLHTAIKGDFVPRNAAGAPESGAGELGTALYPWASGHFSGLIINGVALDPSLATSKANRVVSGRTRTDSIQTDFLRASGSGAAATILATATNLIVSIKGVSVTLAADIALSGLSLAPATNNTALVNDTSMTGALKDKYTGERGTTLTIDAAGSEITALVGQMVALKGASEVLFGHLKSTTEITNCYRGFFFDSSGAPIVREALADNDTLTLLKVGYVFLDSDGSTTDISYTTPVIAYDAPSGPATGDYWLDQINQIWKRWDSANWIDEGRTLIGIVASDTTNCIASRSLDPYVSYSDTNNLELEVLSVTVGQTKDLRGEVHIYGSELDFDLGHLTWDITADLASGLTEAASTTYYAYLDKNGQRILDTERPYERPDLKGYYHPYHAWRCVGELYNDSSSNLIKAYYYAYTSKIIDYSTIELGENLLYGCHEVAQRGTSFAGASTGYHLDGFYDTITNTVTISQESSGAPIGSRYYYKALYGAAASKATTAQALTSEEVEKIKGKTVTASAKVRSGGSFAGDLTLRVQKNGTADTMTGGTWSDIGSVTLANANIPTGTGAADWADMSVTVAIPDDGTANGVRWFVEPSAAGASGEFFCLAQPQLHVGSVVRPVVISDYKFEALLYYWRPYTSVTPATIGNGRMNNSTTNGYANVNLPRQMRAAPTFNNFGCFLSVPGSDTGFSAGPSIYSSIENIVTLGFTVTTPTGATYPVQLVIDSGHTGTCEFIAELT